jgi:hypothetical protein
VEQGLPLSLHTRFTKINEKGNKMNDNREQLEQELERVLDDADLKKLDIYNQEFAELYPSIFKMLKEREASKTPHSWNSDPRTLESVFYHKSLKGMRGGR